MNVAVDALADTLRQVTGAEPETLMPLAGGASDRWYVRVTGPIAARYGVPSLIVMGIAPELWAMFDTFLRVRHFLERKKLPVPALFAYRPDKGIVLLEDLGDLTMMRAVQAYPARKAALYGQAVALLARLHTCTEDGEGTCPAFSLAFDVEKFLYEFDFHVKRWLIGHHFGIRPTPAEQETLERTFRWIAERLAAQPRVFTHRDYQTSNLMVRADGTLSIIDFQDARMGLRQYDLASVVYDSYVELNERERADLVAMYRERAGAGACGEPKPFDHLLRIAAIQRKLHDAGAFVYAAAARGKREYLRYVPDAVRIATKLMAAIPECREAGVILDEYLQRAHMRWAKSAGYSGT